MNMNRRSYYPQNQIVSSVTGASTVSRQASPDPAASASLELYRPRSQRPSGEALIPRPSGDRRPSEAERKPSGEEQAAYAQMQHQWQGYRWCAPPARPIAHAVLTRSRCRT